MTKKTTLLLAFFCLLISTVYAQSVKSDRNTTTDFKKFNTYAWLAPGDSILNRYRSDKLFGGYIVHVANRELTNRGLKMDTLKPDAIFVFYTDVQEITTYSQSAQLSLGVGIGGPGYYMSASGPIAGGKITAATEQDGMLKYVMYDTETQKIVWTGMVEKTFKPTEDVEKIISDYTEKIFKKYPGKKK